MVNLSSFDSFGKLNGLVALEAMNNADWRILQHRKAMDNVFSRGSESEYTAWKAEEHRLESDSRYYADVWIAVRDYEARVQMGIADLAMRVETEQQCRRCLTSLENCRYNQQDPGRQCAYCGSTKGFDGWNCIDCGAC